MYVYHRHLDPCVGTAEPLGPQTVEIGERLPEALRRQAARLLQSMAMFENAIQTSAHRLQQNVALMRIWLLADVEERILMLIEVASDLLKIFLAGSAR